MNLVHGALDSVQAAGWTLHEKGTKTSKDKLKEVPSQVIFNQLEIYKTKGTAES